MGPGLITGVSDDDPSGIVTYSQAGALFGLATLWTALFTYPLMYAIQSMCARIGIVTSGGLTKALKKYYPWYVKWILIVIITPAIIFNIAADIASMGAVIHLMLPYVSPFWFEAAVTLCLIASLIYFPYRKIAMLMKYACLTLLCYCIIPFLVVENWKDVLLATVVPTFHWDQQFLFILVAIFGTTISPYLFLWQSSMSWEESSQNGKSIHTEIKTMKTDVNTGMLFSNIGMYFIILTTGTVLFQHGGKPIETVADAASAIRPLAGELSTVLFAIGVLGVGILTVPILAACIGYLFAETFNWPKGLDKKWSEAKKFYLVIAASLLIGLIANLFYEHPVNMLIYTAVLYGLTAPIYIAFILHICNRKDIMGEHTNSIFINILGLVAFVIMTLSGALLLFYGGFNVTS